jgi:soluble lytic murein transglycosylase-like protein
MIRKSCLSAVVFALPAAAPPLLAQDHHGHADFDALIARNAAVYHVPESLIRRVIRRESGGGPRAVHAGNYGLMQIRLGTARAMGYRGGAAGLLDGETNMTYAVKYLAGAYRAAGGDADRAVHYYAAGYYRAGSGRHRRHGGYGRMLLAHTAARVAPYKY